MKNYFTIYFLIVLELVLFSIVIFMVYKSNQTEWCKQIDVYIPDKNGWVIFAQQDIEFGLRKDGVVVWRKIQK